VVDPERADAELARRPEVEEAEAARRTMLHLSEDGRGTCHGRFRIPTLAGAMLRTALHALTVPEPVPDAERTPHGEDPAGQRPVAGSRLGEAFVRLLERLPVDRLPVAGGLNASITVTLDLHTLRDGLRSARLDTGDTISPGEARRLACEAGLVPMVLNGPSVILDAGRTRRLFTPAMRRAMALRDRTCTAEGCTIPAAWCDAHHKQPWSQGGSTRLADGVLLCRRHHMMAHRSGYQVEFPPSGATRLTRLRRE